MNEDTDLVTNKDRDTSGMKALLKLIPGAGESLSQFIYGKLEEAETRRLHDTVQEIADMVRKQDRTEETKGTEEYFRLFQDAESAVGNATNEDRRQRLRDLLFKSLFIPPGDPGWEESMHCLDLLKEIDAVGLYVLAVIARAQHKEQRIGVARMSQPPRWLTLHESTLPGIPNLAFAPPDWFEGFKYHEILIDRSIKSLVNNTKLIREQDISVTFGNTNTSFPFYFLTPAGEMLVKWTMADF